jgi:protein-tyrosine-phosphatase/predicted phosphodiesterase
MRIAHISDLHFGFEFLKNKFENAIKQINKLEPDITVITGDIGLWGIHHEIRKAYEALSDLESDLLIIPGNHDARNDGIKYFNLYFGKTKRTVKIDDIVLIGVDSTLPDSDDGYIGPEQRQWIAKSVRQNCINIIAMHHHVVPVPHTGRNMNVLIDAAETVESLTLHCYGGIVLAGHRHVPYSTKLLRTHIIHAGSLSSYKVLMPDNNYNIIEISEDGISLKLRFIDIGEVEIGRFKLKPETPESLRKYHKLTSVKKILFISKRNACRTKIAEALFNKISPDNMYAISAGTEPAKDVDPIVSKVLIEMGFSVSTPRKLRRGMEEVDYVISFDEDVDADELWDIKVPVDKEDCKRVVKKIEKMINELVRKIILY